MRILFYDKIGHFLHFHKHLTERRLKSKPPGRFDDKDNINKHTLRLNYEQKYKI